MTQQKLSKTESLLLSIAVGNTYTSEYHGMSSTYCAYCDADLDDSDHESDCQMNEARELLGQIWVDHNNEMNRLANIKQEKERKKLYINGHHHCEYCDHVVAGFQMGLHQRTNLHCIKKQLQKNGYTFKKHYSGLMSCLCCHKTVKASDFKAHYHSKACKKHRNHNTDEVSASCIECHVTKTVANLEFHENSKSCSKFKF